MCWNHSSSAGSVISAGGAGRRAAMVQHQDVDAAHRLDRGLGQPVHVASLLATSATHAGGRGGARGLQLGRGLVQPSLVAAADDDAAPSAASASAIDRPRPLVPPITRARRPFNPRSYRRSFPLRGGTGALGRNKASRRGSPAPASPLYSLGQALVNRPARGDVPNGQADPARHPQAARRHRGPRQPRLRRPPEPATTTPGRPRRRDRPPRHRDRRRRRLRRGRGPASTPPASTPCRPR